MDYASSRELKNIARDKMLGQYGTAIGAFLFMRVILIMLLGMCSSIFGQHRVMMLIAAFIITLFEGIFTYGELSIYLKIAVGMPTQSMDVFSAFRIWLSARFIPDNSDNNSPIKCIAFYVRFDHFDKFFSFLSGMQRICDPEWHSKIPVDRHSCHMGMCPSQTMRR